MRIETLLRSPLFEGFDEDELALLLFGRRQVVRRYPRGKMIHCQGDTVEGLHILAEGSVVTTMTNAEGRSLKVATIQAPAFFAPAFVFASDNRFPVNVETATYCEVIVIGREHLLQQMALHPNLMQNVLRDISDRCAFMSHRLRDFAIGDLKQRILRHISEHGEIKNQADVARQLGVARQSVSRALAELRREGRLP